MKKVKQFSARKKKKNQILIKYILNQCKATSIGD